MPDPPAARPYPAQPRLAPLSLRLFAAVVRHGSLSRAALASNIALSALSKRVSDLESELGTPLLIRSRDGVIPTPEGTRLLGYAERVETLLDELACEFRVEAGLLRGSIRLWATASAVSQFLPEDLAAFIAAHPGVRLGLREESSARIVAAVRDGEADAGIFSSHFVQVALRTRVYRRDTLVVIAPCGHPLESRLSIPFAETLRFDYIVLQGESSLASKLEEEARRCGRELPAMVRVAGFDGVRRMVEAGLGISVLPLGAVQPYLSADRITALDLDERWATRTLHVGYRRHAPVHVALRALLDVLAPEEGSSGAC